MARRTAIANATLRILGVGASLGRRARLTGAVDAVRDAADRRFIRSGRPPLEAHVDGATVRGFLRHRSFLAGAGRPGTTYRELFERTLSPGITVVDGGAHVGLYTLVAARRVGPAGRVLAFEPDPYNFSALSYNTRSEHNVELHQMALGRERRRTQFYVSRGTIGSSLFRRGDTQRVEEIEVTTVDAALASARPVKLVVKLNVEGAEPLVLDGMRATLDGVDDVTMFLELDDAGLRRAGFDAPGLVDRLHVLGFRVHAIDLADGSLRAVDPRVKGHIYCERA